MRTGGRHAGTVDYRLSRGLQRIWAAGLLLSLGLLLGCGVQLGSDLKAAHSQGTRGTWVAEQRVCGKGGCFWRGDFFLPSGTETRQAVTYLGNLTSVHLGLRVPALDAGADGEVYPVSGSHRWIQDIIAMGAGAVGLVLLGGGWFYTRLLGRRGAELESGAG